MKYLAVLLSLVFFIAGCSNPEKEARGLFNNSKVMISEGKLLEAKDQLTKITKEYSSTITATEAIDELGKLNVEFDEQAYSTLLDLKHPINMYRKELNSLPPKISFCDSVKSIKQLDEVPKGINVYYVDFNNGKYGLAAFSDPGLGSKVYSFDDFSSNFGVTGSIRTNSMDNKTIIKYIEDKTIVVEEYKGIKSVRLTNPR